MPYNVTDYWNKNKRTDTTQYGGTLNGTVIPNPVASPGPQNTGGDKGQSLGRFVNFGTYFGANQGQAQQLGQGFGDRLSKGAGEVDAGLDVAKDQFYRANAQGTSRYQRRPAQTPVAAPNAGGDPNPPPAGYTQAMEEQLGTPPTGEPDAFTVGTGLINAPPGGGAAYGPTSRRDGPKAPPTAYNTRPAETSNPNATRPSVYEPPAAYSGPEDIATQEPANWSDLMRRARGVQTAAGQLNTTEGRQALITDRYANTGSYASGAAGGTSGNSRLDSALLGAANGDRFTGLEKQFGGTALEDKLVTANERAKEAAGVSKGINATALQNYNLDNPPPETPATTTAAPTEKYPRGKLNYEGNNGWERLGIPESSWNDFIDDYYRNSGMDVEKIKKELLAGGQSGPYGGGVNQSSLEHWFDEYEKWRKNGGPQGKVTDPKRPPSQSTPTPETTGLPSRRPPLN